MPPAAVGIKAAGGALFLRAIPRFLMNGSTSIGDTRFTRGVKVKITIQVPYTNYVSLDKNNSIILSVEPPPFGGGGFEAFSLPSLATSPPI
jgi:hypothetical protein